jgi:hypothetical protein
VSLVTKCALGELLIVNFNKDWRGWGWGWGQKVVSRPLADYFVVGRRQKYQIVNIEKGHGQKKWGTIFSDSAGFSYAKTISKWITDCFSVGSSIYRV